MSIASVMPSNHLIFWDLLLLPSIFPSIRDFSSESAVCMRWPQYWSFSFSISTSSEYSGLISLKIDWFDLAVQGTLRNILQHHSLKALILKHSLWSSSHYNMWPRKTVALAIWTFVGRVMSLLFNALSACHSFPAKKQLSSDFMAAVIIHSDFRAQDDEICHCFHLSPFYLTWRNESRCHDLVFVMFSYKSTLSPSSFTLIRRLFSSSSLSAVRVISSTYLRLSYFLQFSLFPY